MMINRIWNFNDDMQRFIKDMLPAWFASDIGLLILPDRALPPDHNLTSGFLFQGLEGSSTGAQETAHKVILGKLICRDGNLEAFAGVGLAGEICEVGVGETGYLLVEEEGDVGEGETEGMDGRALPEKGVEEGGWGEGEQGGQRWQGGGEERGSHILCGC